MGDAIEVSREAARRFVLGKQGLWPGRRWQGREGTRLAMVACEHLQLDPLVIVARSHDLMLHARVLDYRPEYFHELTYGERQFFDWGGWLAVRPMEELPYWRVPMLRHRHLPEHADLFERYAGLLEELRGLLRERGTLASRDISRDGVNRIEHYRGSTDAAVALYQLWRTGEAMTHHREGFERVYAPAEAVAPSHLLTPVAEDEADLFLARKQIAFRGIGRAGPLRRLLGRSFTRSEEQAIELALLARGEIARVSVRGWRGPQYVLSADLPLLEAIRGGEVPEAWRRVGPSTEEEAVLLSPLDPVSARGRAKELFDFEYTWEIYKPAEQVLFGRYTMPVLWGDRLVGRIDPRMDRASGTLVINGAWFEPGYDSRNGILLDALAAGVRRLMAFLDAGRIDVAGLADSHIRRRLRGLKG